MGVCERAGRRPLAIAIAEVAMACPKGGGRQGGGALLVCGGVCAC